MWLLRLEKPKNLNIFKKLEKMQVLSKKIAKAIPQQIKFFSNLLSKP